MTTKKFSKLEYKYRAFKYRFRDDKDELSYIIDKVQRGNSVLDIGAHKGGYLYWLRKSVGESGTVHAFEPQPILYNYLKTAIGSLRYKNVSLHHAGLSSSEGEMELFVPKASGLTSPGATFEKRENTDNGHFHTIPVHTIDILLKDRKNKIDFIKMDVEGHELEVFKGANNLLKKDKPIILFECENRHLNGISVADVFSYLTELGYNGKFFWEGNLLDIQEFDASVHQAIDAQKEIIDKKKYANNFVFEPR